MVVDRDGYVFGFALRAGVESADDALQFGEFLDEFGGEVGFRKLRGYWLRPVSLAASEFGARRRRGSRCGFFEIGAELGLERDAAEIDHAIGEGPFLIGVPEEAGVVEAGSQDAFVAVLDQAFGVAVGVGYGDELGGEFAVGGFDREVFLVVAHHHHEDFFGEVEEFGIEVAGDRQWDIRSG